MKRLLFIVGFYFIFGCNCIYSQSKINAYEYWYDDNYQGAIFTNIIPVIELNLSSNFSTNLLNTGLHRIHFRFRDINNKWSCITSQLFYKANSFTFPNKINRYRFWFDNFDNIKTEIDIIPPITQKELSLSISPGNLPIGMHRVHFQFRDIENIWSVVTTDTFSNAGCSAPTIQTSELSFSSVDYTQMTVNWINGNGSRRIIKINTVNSFTDPSNGTDPPANSSYSGFGEQVIYSNDGNSVNITGLNSNTTYWFRVYEANCTGSSSLYNFTLASNNPRSQTTLSSCVSPTIQASNLSFTSVGTNQMTFNWQNGDGNRRVVIMNTTNSFTVPLNGTDPSSNSTYNGSGEQVVYNGAGNNISVNGLIANTTYWFRVYEANCNGNTSLYNFTTGSNNPKSQITLSSCIAPSIQASNISFPSVGTTQMTVKWIIGNGSRRIVKINTVNSFTAPVNGTDPIANATYNGSGEQVVYNGNSDNVDISGLTANTTYWFRVYEANCNGSGSLYNINTGSNNPKSQITDMLSSPTIKISSYIIPPWQRENDAFNGSITVDFSNAGVNPQWHIEADAFNELGTYMGYINIGLGTTTNSISFTSNQVNIYIHQGWHFNWSAVLESNNKVATASIQTNIIEAKWVNKNVLYYNIQASTNAINSTIKLPLKYIDQTDRIRIVFMLDENTSKCITCNLNTLELLKLNNSSLNSNLCAITINNTCDNFYAEIPVSNNPVNVDYKTTINLNNISSNINSSIARAGEYFYAIDYLKNNGTTNIEHEEGKFDLTKYGYLGSLLNNDTSIVIVGGNRNTIEEDFQKLNGSSNKDFSIAENFHFGSPIGSINANYNTWYISQGNVNYFENNAYDISLALEAIINETSPKQVHLVTHSFGGLQIRAMLAGMGKKNDGTSGLFNYNDLIKSVTFLSTPHRGVSIGLWKWLVGNAKMEARVNSTFFLDLDKKKYPDSIRFLNISGIDYSYLSPTDGVVDLWSSEHPYLKNISGKQIIINQLYIKKWEGGGLYNLFNPFLSIAHSMTHHTNISSNISYSIPDNYSTLNRVFNFIRGGNLTQVLIHGIDQINSIYGSKLPGSKINIKYKGETDFHFKSITNENGTSIISYFPKLQLGDSIKIEASGYETLVIPADTSLLKLEIPMVKDYKPTNKVQKASLNLVNQNPITNNENISIESTGQNVIDYQVNSPFNQDTNFISLNLINHNFNVKLDTGFNNILVRFIGAVDTVILSKEIYYFPDSLMNINTYNIHVVADKNSVGAKLYANNQFIKDIKLMNEYIPFLIGRNTIALTKFGYIDSLFTVDSSTTINLALQLIPHSYSSPFDSSIVNFAIDGKLQYRMNVTMLDSLQKSILSLKQYDDNFIGTGLMAKSRKFEFRHLNAPDWSNIKTAIVLDQIDNLKLDSIYLMKIDDDTAFSKIFFDTLANIANYDPEVQKLTFNYINFNNGVAEKEAIVIMKRQAPIVKSITTLIVNENDNLIIPLAQLFSDPDSIPNDMTFQLPNTNPNGLNLSISNGNLIVNTVSCFSGNTSFTIQAIHDGLIASNSVNISVLDSSPPIITVLGTLTFCPGDSVTLQSSAANSYLWSTGASIQIITVHDPGNYVVTITDSIGCSATSLVTTLVENPPINLTFTSTNESSSSALDGSATVYASGGSGPYSYLWNNSNNATSQSVNGLAAGNYSVTVTDLNTGCKSLGSVIVQLSNSSSNFTISGNISVPATNQNVGLVEVEMSGTNVSSQTTNNTGNYSLTAPAFSNVIVKPFKDIFPTNGFTGLDLAIIQQHITNPNTPTLITPYQLIAADCNHDGFINGIDLAVGQALILGNISSFPNNTSWVFVPKSYSFSNPLNPFAPPFPSSLSYSNLSSDNLNQDFWGIKIGDVQYSASPTLASGANEVRDYVDKLNFVTYDNSLSKGSTIQLEFTSENFKDILAYQFTLEADPDYLEIVEPKSGVLPGMNQDYFGMKKSNEGLLTSVWYNNTGYNLYSKENVFGLNLKVKKGGKKLSECLKLSDKEILTTAYNSNYKPIEIGLKFLSDVKNIPQYTFELYQNQPNPFKNTTIISFSLPEAERASIQIMDLNGKVIKSIEKNFDNGINREEVKLENVSQGVYYYKVSTSEHSGVRKMVVID